MSATWSEAESKSSPAIRALDSMRTAVSDAAVGRDVVGMAEPAAIPEVVAIALASIAESLAAMCEAVEKIANPLRIVEDVEFPGRGELWQAWQDNALSAADLSDEDARSALRGVAERDALRRHLAAALLDLGAFGVDRREWVDILPLCSYSIHHSPVARPRDNLASCCVEHLRRVADGVWHGDQ